MSASPQDHSVLPMTSTPSPRRLVCSESSAMARWNLLAEHVLRWFHRPDLEALRISLAAACAHYIVSADPVWLFVLGPAGSGKTTLIINALRNLPHAQIIGSITPKTFISHYKGRSDASLLARIGKSGLLLFKDFTTFLSQHPHDQADLNSQLREIYDGEFKRGTGVGEFHWTGKITTVGVCTSAFEAAMTFHREMGDRFVQVRWPRVDGIEMARAAGRQRGHEPSIYGEISRLSADFCMPSRLLPGNNVSSAMSERIAAMAEFTARARGIVKRDRHDNIAFVPPAEQATRLHKSMELVVSTHAKLFEHDEAQLDDYKLAVRLGWDCIPINRSRILGALPPDGTPIYRADLTRLLGIPESTVKWNLDDLLALGLVILSQDSLGQVGAALDPAAAALVTQACGDKTGGDSH